MACRPSQPLWHPQVKLECLEVLNDLLRRFAAHLTEDESRDCLGALFGAPAANCTYPLVCPSSVILSRCRRRRPHALTGELTSSRAAARKRAIACIASLSASLPDRMLEGQLVGAILAQMNSFDVKLDLRRTYIQTCRLVRRRSKRALRNHPMNGRR